MYDPSPARFISEDPLGFDAGDSNLYRYVFNSPTHYTDPTGEQVFIPNIGPITPTIPKPINTSCFTSCIVDNYGLKTGLGVGGATAVGLGQPTIPYPRAGIGSRTGATSPASKFLSRVFPQRLPVRLPTPTIGQLGRTTPVLGRALGRWVPIVGWGLLAVDASLIASCSAKCEEDSCFDKL